MKTITFLNPGKVPVMACDCPIFAVAKKARFSVTFQDKFLVMFGGLKLEKKDCGIPWETCWKHLDEVMQ